MLAVPPKIGSRVENRLFKGQEWDYRLWELNASPQIRFKRHLVAKSPFGPQTAVLYQGILEEFGGGLGLDF